MHDFQYSTRFCTEYHRFRIAFCIRRATVPSGKSAGRSTGRPGSGMTFMFSAHSPETVYANIDFCSSNSSDSSGRPLPRPPKRRVGRMHAPRQDSNLQPSVPKVIGLSNVPELAFELSCFHRRSSGKRATPFGRLQLPHLTVIATEYQRFCINRNILSGGSCLPTAKPPARHRRRMSGGAGAVTARCPAKTTPPMGALTADYAARFRMPHACLPEGLRLRRRKTVFHKVSPG